MSLQKKVQRQVFLDLFASPSTILPVVFGATSLLLSWGLGGFAWLSFLGACGIIGGVGFCLTRLIFNLDKITERAYEYFINEQNAERQQTRKQSLKVLKSKLLLDNDDRTEVQFTALGHLYKRFQKEVSNSTLNIDSGLIMEKVEELFDACMSQLETSYNLYVTSSKLSGSSKKPIVEQRENILKEIDESIALLGKTISEFQSLSTNRNGQDLSRLREELDRSMEVAKIAEERMSEITVERIKES